MPHLADIVETSRYLGRLLAAKPSLAAEVESLLQQPVSAEELSAWLEAQPLTEANLKPMLRQLKQRAYARIAARDLAGLAPLAEVTECMTLIAELAVRKAVEILTPGLVERYGTPRGVDGGAQDLIVIGMGKLGGRELNVSSDIDLIFVFPEDGETDSAPANSRSISNFEFFNRLGRGLINAIAEATEDGQVFRVDMRLRPNGDSGPLVCSFEMLENYFIVQGREWERYAWIKARPLTGSRHDELEQIRLPFVFRKYFDFGAINAMRRLHAQIRREVAKKDMADNIKLGPGGIREIEFIAQVFQLIRGGRDAPLQIKPTQKVLALLAERGTLTPDAAGELDAAYGFLRRLEHRLQYLDDAQTHSLPLVDEDRQRVAKAMGFASFEALLAELDDHRATVSRHFEQVFSDPDQGEHVLAGLWNDAGGDDQEENFERLGYRNPPAAVQRMVTLRAAPLYQQMPRDIRRRFDVLVPRLIEAAAALPNPDETLSRGIDLLESISRRAAYLALLQQYPQALQKVAELVSSASWAANYLQRHPILLDELLDPRLLQATFDWSVFRRQLRERLAELEPDTEQQMDVLREAHHAQSFRLLTQDIAGLLTVEALADHLSALADALLDAAIEWAWTKVIKRHVATPKFAVISYGKLGGKELGYASDLDLVFLFDDEAPDAAENYSRLGTRLNTWLSAQTSAGQLFETDLRLRPNGESGLVVSSIEAFRKYQIESAWVWEHQALTRARFSAGDPAVGDAFERIRCEVLRQKRDLATLSEEVLAMRRKMLDAHGTKGDQCETVFDLKHDPGGLVDVEFIVQYLVLGYSHQHAELTGNLGNIALLKIAGDLGLIAPALAEQVRNAYRDYRRMQHALRLNGARPRVAPEQVQQRVDAVRDLWHQVFETR
ncbi:MAG: bifunctional [glutamate--ammonia ligase]-adenylyl-L-tyrosine phosphorylase/[glutamate--ammonia-ligase] adenylyltransferase [Burkholderiaceae bacterium]|nr:bifunctional [glutamate--ammonia ligase]-adenylyl-L-tyrosine phosphorylase/[glutamate--ammonia-ligase] adenylyltransferase [Sulfuritalea sp.]MCF8174440.1 bifunctional [glutamate--ammonia ligase]-adenylyl-L-tyrosine phosphorylase/[glutamate--ammonia-ligase] adenylyltransferase [Burkholderiaceae bacterium]MCF8183773.1 bifunctional [glutamate--ammonia ligase]-adenylyl-L-tyrosine phosphorylase/[glutamate--ammonia-ligase] adenylyltransferase [Polynucleobacter sp.]